MIRMNKDEKLDEQGKKSDGQGGKIVENINQIPYKKKCLLVLLLT